MVREDCTAVAIQVGPVLLDSPNNTQCLHLCHTIVALMCLQGSACKRNWIHRPIILLLRMWDMSVKMHRCRVNILVVRTLDVYLHCV